MKKSLLRLISIMLSILMLFSLSACEEKEKPVGADNNKSATEWRSVEKDDVTISAKLNKESYEIGESILVFYKIENASSLPIYQRSFENDNFEINGGIEKDGEQLYKTGNKGYDSGNTFPKLDAKQGLEGWSEYWCVVYNKTDYPSGEYEVVFEIRYCYENPEEKHDSALEWIEQKITFQVQLETPKSNDNAGRDDIKYDLK